MVEKRTPLFRISHVNWFWNQVAGKCDSIKGLKGRPPELNNYETSRALKQNNAARPSHKLLTRHEMTIRNPMTASSQGKRRWRRGILCPWRGNQIWNWRGSGNHPETSRRTRGESIEQGWSLPTRRRRGHPRSIKEAGEGDEERSCIRDPGDPASLWENITTVFPGHRPQTMAITLLYNHQVCSFSLNR